MKTKDRKRVKWCTKQMSMLSFQGLLCSFFRNFIKIISVIFPSRKIILKIDSITDVDINLIIKMQNHHNPHIAMISQERRNWKWNQNHSMLWKIEEQFYRMAENQQMHFSAAYIFNLWSIMFVSQLCMNRENSANYVVQF